MNRFLQVIAVLITPFFASSVGDITSYELGYAFEACNGDIEYVDLFVGDQIYYYYSPREICGEKNTYEYCLLRYGGDSDQERWLRPVGRRKDPTYVPTSQINIDLFANRPDRLFKTCYECEPATWSRRWEGCPGTGYDMWVSEFLDSQYFDTFRLMVRCHLKGVDQWPYILFNDIGATYRWFRPTEQWGWVRSELVDLWYAQTDRYSECHCYN